VTLPEMGDFRWLTVGPPDQEDFSVVLMAIPEPPIFKEDTAAMLKEIVSRGVASPIFLTTDDCQGAYEELKGRGVEFVDAPEERPYGIDASFRDPSGNQIRLIEGKDVSAFDRVAQKA
jgi:hypothetical protein